MTLRLNKFCCCCTTRTGALVIGTLGWIFTIIQLFAGVDPQQKAQDRESQRVLINQISGKSENDYDDMNDYGYNNIYFKVGYGLVSLIVCILLVLGVYKKDKRYILPWLVLKGFEVAIATILSCIVFFMACSHGVGILFAIFFICLLATALQVYFWLCIWSHYKDLGDEPDVGVSTAYSPPPQYMEKPLNMV